MAGLIHIGTCLAISVGGLCMSRHWYWRLAHVEAVSQLVLTAPSHGSHVSTLLASGDGGIVGLAISDGGILCKTDPSVNIFRRDPV